jgi:hypothetical protein
VTLKIRNEIRKLQENPLLGEYRVHTALFRMGIEVSPATCGRIMAANRQLYGLEKPQRQPRAKLEMPFRASHRHEYWSADIRYIEEHLLPDPRPVYVITIFENFSRMVLSSAISTSQTQWDYLAVLTDAIRRYGAPEALVTDGGGQFRSTVALQLYDMLGIRKEQIDPGEPWENYAETLFSIQRRMADHAFSNARTWPEVQKAHQTWWHNYNVEKHYAHRERQDERHSPVEVLRGMLGHAIPEEVLSRALYATQFTRQCKSQQFDSGICTIILVETSSPCHHRRRLGWLHRPKECFSSQMQHPLVHQNNCTDSTVKLLGFTHYLQQIAPISERSVLL